MAALLAYPEIFEPVIGVWTNRADDDIDNDDEDDNPPACNAEWFDAMLDCEALRSRIGGYDSSRSSTDCPVFLRSSETSALQRR